MVSKEELELHNKMIQALEDTFIIGNDEFNNYENNVVNDIMIKFSDELVKSIYMNSPGTGIQFPILRSAFSYLYVKTIDAVLIQEEEKVLMLGHNFIYDFNDVLQKFYGVSEYFEQYEADPDNECALGEEYFYSFQDFIVDNAEYINENPYLLHQLIIDAFLWVIATAIKRGMRIINL